MDGSSFPAMVDVTAATDESGRVSRRIVNVWDTALRKEAERALESAVPGL